MADRNPPALPTLCPFDWISVCGHRETESCNELTGYCVVRSHHRSPLTLASAEAEETSFLGVWGVACCQKQVKLAPVLGLFALSVAVTVLGSRIFFRPDTVGTTTCVPYPVLLQPRCHDWRLTNISLSATSWEQYTCTSNGHLSVSHWLSVNVTRVNHQYLTTYGVVETVSIPTTRSYLRSRQVACVWEVRVASYVEWPATRIVRTGLLWPGEYLPCVSGYERLPYKAVVEIVYMSVCAVHC